MTMKKRKIWLFLGFTAILFIGMSMFTGSQSNLSVFAQTDNYLGAKYSTTMGSPVSLIDGTPIYEDFDYTLPVLYYYNYSMSTSNYHLFWIRENGSSTVVD